MPLVHNSFIISQPDCFCDILQQFFFISLIPGNPGRSSWRVTVGQVEYTRVWLSGLDQTKAEMALRLM
jgi:hypothetical protein